MRATRRDRQVRAAGRVAGLRDREGLLQARRCISRTSGSRPGRTGSSRPDALEPGPATTLPPSSRSVPRRRRPRQPVRGTRTSTPVSEAGCGGADRHLTRRTSVRVVWRTHVRSHPHSSWESPFWPGAPSRAPRRRTGRGRWSRSGRTTRSGRSPNATTAATSATAIWRIERANHLAGADVRVGQQLVLP